MTKTHKDPTVIAAVIVAFGAIASAWIAFKPRQAELSAHVSDIKTDREVTSISVLVGNTGTKPAAISEARLAVQSLWAIDPAISQVIAIKPSNAYELKVPAKVSPPFSISAGVSHGLVPDSAGAFDSLELRLAFEEPPQDGVQVYLGHLQLISDGGVEIDAGWLVFSEPRLTTTGFIGGLAGTEGEAANAFETFGEGNINVPERIQKQLQNRSTALSIRRAIKTYGDKRRGRLYVQEQVKELLANVMRNLPVVSVESTSDPT